MIVNNNGYHKSTCPVFNREPQQAKDYNPEDITIPITKGSILLPKTLTGTGSAVVLGITPIPTKRLQMYSEGSHNYVRVLTDYGNTLVLLDSEVLRDYKIIGTCRNIKERVEYQIQILTNILKEEFSNEHLEPNPT